MLMNFLTANINVRPNRPQGPMHTLDASLLLRTNREQHEPKNCAAGLKLP
ncbi:MAG: hypothetical protein ABIO19_08900 [Burkholderiaceae bacterium]